MDNAVIPYSTNDYVNNVAGTRPGSSMMTSSYYY